MRCGAIRSIIGVKIPFAPNIIIIRQTRHYIQGFMKVKNRKFDKKEEQGAALPGSSFCFAELLCGGNALRQPLFYGIQTEIYSPGNHIDGKSHFS